MQKHIQGIDFLRFLAALMVTLFHLNQANLPVHNFYRNIVNHGWLGVPIFFVISGFCITLSIQFVGNAKEFYLKRFFRIFPAYWFSLLLVFFSAVFQKLYIGSSAIHYLPKTFMSFCANVTLLTTPLTKVPTINWVYWSLSVELLFYAVVGIGLVKKSLLSYYLIVLSILGALIKKQETGLLFFLDHWPSFGLGISLYYLLSKQFIKEKKIGFFLMIINVCGLVNKFESQYNYWISTLLTFCLIIFFVKYPIKSQFLSNLGKQSYAVYLIHVPVGVFILGLFQNNIVMKNPMLNLLWDLAVVIIVNILACFIYNKIEVVAIELAKKIIEKKYSFRQFFFEK